MLRGRLSSPGLTDQWIHSGYFDDQEELARQVAALDTDQSVQGIYVTLNEVNRPLLSRRANRIKMRLGKKDATTSDADILRRQWFPIDIDPVRPSGVSSTDEEHQAALVRAAEIAAFLDREQGWPAPVMADSGNGAHLLYRIDLPNDEESRDLVKKCLDTLDTMFSNSAVTVDTANFNAARIWKIYGTTSRKGDNTKDRPHRKSLMLSGDDQLKVVDTSFLRTLAELFPCAPPEIKGYKKALDLREWLTCHGLHTAHEKPYQGGTLFVWKNAHSQEIIRTGRLRSSSQTGQSMPGATTRVAAVAGSGGRRSGISMSRVVRSSGSSTSIPGDMNGWKPERNMKAT